MPRKYLKSRCAGNKEKPIKRQCLKCDRAFIAQGRFNRICSNCQITNQSIPDVERYKIVYY